MSDVKTTPPSSGFKAGRIQLQFHPSNHRSSRNAAGMEVEELTSNRGIRVGDMESAMELVLLPLPSSSKHRGDLKECRAELNSPTRPGSRPPCSHLSRTAPNLLSQEGN